MGVWGVPASCPTRPSSQTRNGLLNNPSPLTGYPLKPGVVMQATHLDSPQGLSCRGGLAVVHLQRDGVADELLQVLREVAAATALLQSEGLA